MKLDLVRRLPLSLVNSAVFPDILRPELQELPEIRERENQLMDEVRAGWILQHSYLTPQGLEVLKEDPVFQAEHPGETPIAYYLYRDGYQNIRPRKASLQVPAVPMDPDLEPHLERAMKNRLKLRIHFLGGNAGVYYSFQKKSSGEYLVEAVPAVLCCGI